MSDEVPDYPPGSRGPEEDVPGVRLDLSAEQVSFIGSLVVGIERASSVTIEDRGAGYLEVTVYGPEAEELVKRTVYPVHNRR